MGLFNPLIPLLAGSVPLAYIDPTVGGVLIQMLLGGSAGVVLLASILRHRLKRTLWQPLKRALSRDKPSGFTDGSAPTSESPE